MIADTNMVRVILESPFAATETASIEQHIRYARMCIRDCLRRNESAIASHLLYTQEGILDDTIPEERALGIAAGLAWRTAADKSVFYTDFGWSRGMLAALESAKAASLPFEVRSLMELCSGIGADNRRGMHTTHEHTVPENAS